jgi:quercetin dioxygenase-like cupin family protein
MKTMKLWMFAAILTLCSTATLMTSCKKSCHCTCTQTEKAQTETVQADEAVTEVQATELIRTSQSWDGVELPDYFKGRPELVAVKYVFPAGKKLGWHHHPVMNYGILAQGELTIIGKDGQEKVVHEGEPVVEMVNTIHHGENRGDKPVILYMFYLSQKDLPLAVQHPEIPLE